MLGNSLSEKGDRSIFCSNEVTFGVPLGSSRMGAGFQKDPAIIRRWELSAPSPQPLGRGDGLEVELITNGTILHTYEASIKTFLSDRVQRAEVGTSLAGRLVHSNPERTEAPV